MGECNMGKVFNEGDLLDWGTYRDADGDLFIVTHSGKVACGISHIDGLIYEADAVSWPLTKTSARFFKGIA